MMHPRTRLLAAACLAISAAAAGSAVFPAAQTRPGPRVEISFTPAARSEPVTGMVYLAISRDNQQTPIQQADPDGVPLFSKYVEDLRPGATVTLDASDRGHPVRSLADIPAGEYWVQPFVNVYT